MKQIIITLTLVLAVVAAAQQDENAVKYAETITVDDLSSHLHIIASDALEGRDTGKPGQKMAAAYISEAFRSLGLKGPLDGQDNPYYQYISLFTYTPAQVQVRAGDFTFSMNDNMAFFGGKYDTEGWDEESFLYAGTSDETLIESALEENMNVVIELDSGQSWYNAWNRIRRSGDVITVIAMDDLSSIIDWTSGRSPSLVKDEITEQSKNRILLFITKDQLDEFLQTSERNLEKARSNIAAGNYKKPLNATNGFSSAFQKNIVPTENVLGYLPGATQPEELIVLTAHYDHVGRNGDEIYNGADDDGSGTVTILEMAEAFVKASKDGHGPARSILFMTVTGEEKGLLGSEYYVENPVFPLENTVANLNIDMIGRIDEPHQENPNYVYLVGSDRLSQDLHELSEQVNQTYTQFDLDYTYNEEDHPDRIYYRSDHWNFAKNNIPVIFYFNGVHEDYHQPTDTVEKIEYELLERRARLVFYTAWEIANRQERLKLNPDNTGD